MSKNCEIHIHIYIYISYCVYIYIHIHPTVSYCTFPTFWVWISHGISPMLQPAPASASNFTRASQHKPKACWRSAASQQLMGDIVYGYDIFVQCINDYHNVYECIWYSIMYIYWMYIDNIILYLWWSLYIRVNISFYIHAAIFLHTTGYSIFVLIMDMIWYGDCEKVCLDHRDQASPIITARSFWDTPWLEINMWNHVSG